MLVLARRKNESVILDLRQFGLGLIRVSPAEIRLQSVRIGFEADERIQIHREEVFDVIEREKIGRAS